MLSEGEWSAQVWPSIDLPSADGIEIRFIILDTISTLLMMNWLSLIRLAVVGGASHVCK